MIYELHKSRLHLVAFAVDSIARRTGIGSLLLTKLVHKLKTHQRQRITLVVRESNLIAQLFFRAYGFVATKILPDYYKETSEKAYYMQYRPNLSLEEISSLSNFEEVEQ